MIIEAEYMMLIFFFVGIAIGAAMARFIGGKMRDPKIGTLYIDMKDASRDICRFSLDKDLQAISQMERASLKIVNLSEESKHLESFEDS